MIKSLLLQGLGWLNKRLRPEGEMFFCDYCDCFHLTTAPHVKGIPNLEELDFFGYIQLENDYGERFDYYKERK